MTVSLDDIIAEMTPEQRDRVSRLAAEFEREEQEWLAATRERFEIYREPAGDFRFRLVAHDGAVLAHSGLFATRTLAEEAVATIRRSAADADVVFAAA